MTLARFQPYCIRSCRWTRRRDTQNCIVELEQMLWLAEITGYDAISLQPNAGSQGEYAGLLAIQVLPSKANGEEPPRYLSWCRHPPTAPIPASSAKLAGMKVVVVDQAP